VTMTDYSYTNTVRLVISTVTRTVRYRRGSVLKKLSKKKWRVQVDRVTISEKYVTFTKDSYSYCDDSTFRLDVSGEVTYFSKIPISDVPAIVDAKFHAAYKTIYNEARKYIPQLTQDVTIPPTNLRLNLCVLNQTDPIIKKMTSTSPPVWSIQEVEKPKSSNCIIS